MEGLPKDILIQEILDRLYGRDALNFMHSSPTFFKLMTPIQRLIHVRSARNLSFIQPNSALLDSDERFECEYCKQMIKATRLSRHYPRCKSRLENSGKTLHKCKYNIHDHDCPLHVTTCKICDSKGPVGQLFPWRTTYKQIFVTTCVLCTTATVAQDAKSAF